MVKPRRYRSRRLPETVAAAAAVFGLVTVVVWLIADQQDRQSAGDGSARSVVTEQRRDSLERPLEPAREASRTTSRVRSQVAVLSLSARSPDPGIRVELLSVTDRSDPVPVRRRWVLTEYHLVVSILDQGGLELSRTLVLDPMIIRAELFGPDGAVKESHIVTRDTELAVAYPFAPDARWLVVHRPTWDGSAFEPREIAKVPLPGRDGTATP